MAAVGGPGPPDPLGYGTSFRQTSNGRRTSTNADDRAPSGDHVYRFGDYAEHLHAQHRTSYDRAQDQQYLVDQEQNLRQNASESRHAETAERSDVHRRIFGRSPVEPARQHATEYLSLIHI